MSNEESALELRDAFRYIFSKMLTDDVEFVCTIGLAQDGVFELYMVNDFDVDKLQAIADYLLKVIEKYKARGN